MNRKVAMIVLNSVSHDIRVLKEARSLKKANYDVSIIGILDNRSLSYEEIDGIKVFRTTVVTAIQDKILLALSQTLIKPWKLICMVTAILCYLIFLQIDSHNSLKLFSLNFLTGFYTLAKQSINSPGLALFYGCFFILFGEIAHRFLLREFKKFKKRTKMNLYNIIRPFFELFKIKKIKMAIQDTLIKIDPDIVHCHDLNALIIGAAYKRTKKGHCTLVYDSHEIFENTNGSVEIRRKIFTYIQNKLAKQVDGFITVNQSIADYLKSKYPSLPEVCIIKNASVFKTIKNNENMFTKYLNIPENRKIILFQGGFGAGRGLAQLVKASNFLRYDWIVIFMGWGKLQNSLENLAKANGSLNSCVFFCNKVTQEELPYWTSSATIGIIPYENTCLNHFYCSPNKLWEYTLAGVPILASPFPEMKKVIDQGVGWLLEDPISEINIANIINSLSDEDIQRAKEKSMEFIKKDNWSKYEERLTVLYDSLRPVEYGVQ